MTVVFHFGFEYCANMIEIAHWLAVEGVQPSIPQNPTSAEYKHQELLPKGPNTSSNLAAISGSDSVSVKPLVKHILSKELQLYFERVCSALLDENDDEYRLAALASLRTDPGLHQLVPYFVQFISEKVTHNLKDLFVLTQMIHLASAMLENPSLYVEPYVASIVPPILTCLIGRRLGNGGNATGAASSADPLAHFALRDISASLLLTIARKYGKSSNTLKPRLARTCLRHFLDPNKLFGSHYGALVGLQGLTGPEGVRTLVLPNLKDYEALVLKDGMAADEGKKAEAEMVVKAIMAGLESLERDSKVMLSLSNGSKKSAETGNDNGNGGGDEKQRRERARLVEMVGEIIGDRVLQTTRQSLIQAVLSSDNVI